MFFASAKVYSPLTAQQQQQDAAPPVMEVNPNIMSIDLGNLSKSVRLLTGDPSVCTNCSAVFSFHSKLSSDNVWYCEFCSTKNDIEMDEEELPTGEDSLDYLLVPAGEIKSISNNEERIIFIVDISGSMCVTSEIQGKVKLRGDKSTNEADQYNHGNVNDQYLPGQNRNITYVSRLQCVQAAIEDQIKTLHKEKPNTKVGLIVFNNEVTIFGDGSQSVTVTGDKLHNFDELIRIGEECKFDVSVGDSKEQLISKLFSLEETGSTALGPALVIGIGMCASFPGSKIVLATDGLANMGVGAMDTPEQAEDAIAFYDKVSLLAKDKSLIGNIIGIRGDQLNIGLIGKLADTTQGDVDIVDPAKITDTFSSMLDNVLIATDVKVKLILHKGFEFPKDDCWTLQKDSTSAERDIGNVYEDMEITAEFVQKPFLDVSKIMEEKGEENVEGDETSLPFQVQITYTALSGQQCLRVITKSRELTNDVEEVTNDIDIAVMGMHANVKTANLASHGMLDEVLRQQQCYGKVIRKNVDDEQLSGYQAWNTTNQGFTHHIQQQQQQQQQQQPYHQQQMQNVYAPQDQQQQQQNTDDTSNDIYRQRNCRANKKQWSKNRKF